MTSVRIYKRGTPVGKNQMLLRYDWSGTTDFILTITKEMVAVYIMRTSPANYSDAFRQATIMKASDIRGWQAIMDQDERFYEYVKSMKRSECKRLYERYKPKPRTEYVLTWLNGRICMKSFRSLVAAKKSFERCEWPCSLAAGNGGQWRGIASKRPETLITAFRAQRSADYPKGLQIEREKCRDEKKTCEGCPIGDCSTMRKLKGEQA